MIVFKGNLFVLLHTKRSIVFAGCTSGLYWSPSGTKLASKMFISYFLKREGELVSEKSHSI